MGVHVSVINPVDLPVPGNTNVSDTCIVLCL